MLLDVALEVGAAPNLVHPLEQHALGVRVAALERKARAIDLIVQARQPAATVAVPIAAVAGRAAAGATPMVTGSTASAQQAA